MALKKIAKLLKIKQLSAKVNFSLSLHLNGKKFYIPIIKNMGLLNVAVKEDWLIKLFKKLALPKEASFIDVGVNVGQTLLKFRSCYENPYWGFEPNPNCVYYLKELIKKNNLKNTQIIPVGLSTGNELAKFYLKNEVDSAGTIVKDLRPDYYETEEVDYVPLFSLDNLKLDVKNIALIKIDVEGAELEVLSGMTETLKKHKPVVACEILDCHSEKSMSTMQARADKLVALMKQTGFNMYKIVYDDKNFGFEKIENVVLKLWTPESWNMNDYLFVPEERNISLS